MTSPSYRHSIPSPRRESPRPPSLGGSSTPRSSVDHQRSQYPTQQHHYSTHLPESSSSSSRRPSNGSLRQSPTSMSSHAHSQRGSISLSANEAPAPGMWSGGNGEPNGRLPRIKTSHADEQYHSQAGEGGPRSAPINGPLRPPPESYPSNGPMRSSSSPDPWLSHSRGTSPSRSPTDYRTNFASGSPLSGPSVLAGQEGRSGHGHGMAQAPPGNILIPPRSSSQSEYSRPITPESSVHMSTESYDPGSTPRNAADAAPVGSQSDRTLQHQQQQQHSSSTASGTTSRSGKRHEPAYCGQCGEVVHGQFVRAMGKVYHLHCFRCKVSHQGTARSQNS